MKWVAHVYLANFYSSVQLGLKPELAEKPLIILNHNRVLDVNPLAARMGVKLRSSRRHAYQLCPEGIYLNYAEEDYRPAVAETLTACLNYTPIIEPVAENEFYLELAGPHSPPQVIQELSLSLASGYCSGLSAGLGANKLLAKLVNMAISAGRIQPSKVAVGEASLGKYHWLNSTGQEEIDNFLQDLPIFYLWVLDKNSRERLNRLGFVSIGEVAQLDVQLLSREFGTQGGSIKESARGQDLSRVLALYPSKDISQEVKFPGGLADLIRLELAIKEIGEHLSGRLENQGCRKLSLELELEEGSKCGSRSFSTPQNRVITFQEVLTGMLKGMELTQPVMSARIIAQDLRSIRGVQMSMFEDPKALAGRDKQQQRKLNTLLDSLGKRFAPHNFSLGKQEHLSRREQMLKFWDPLRFKER
jgi:DNA polymerase IV